MLLSSSFWGQVTDQKTSGQNIAFIFINFPKHENVRKMSQQKHQQEQQKIRMSEKCRNNKINKHNNNSDNALTSRRADGGKNT